MTIHSFIGKDGSARVELDGITIKLRAATVDEARAEVHKLAVEHAAQTGKTHFFKAEDPSGSWPMYVNPNGTTVAAPADIVPRVGDSALALPDPKQAFAPADTRSGGSEVEGFVVDRQHQRAVVSPAPVRANEAELSQPVNSAVAAHAAVTRPVAVEEDDRTVFIPRKTKRTTLIVLTAPNGVVAAALNSNAIVGRNPIATSDREAVQLYSPGRELSRTHAAIDLDEQDRIIVTDLGAANGVYVTAPGAYAHTGLVPHLPTEVVPGSKILLGDVTFSIELNQI